jgi:hypothetical protein
MAAEVTISIPEWTIWIPIAVSMATLWFTVKTHMKSNKRDEWRAMEKQIDDARDEIRKYKEHLVASRTECESIRKDNIALLEKLVDLKHGDKSSG